MVAIGLYAVMEAKTMDQVVNICGGLQGEGEKGKGGDREYKHVIDKGRKKWKGAVNESTAR